MVRSSVLFRNFEVHSRRINLIDSTAEIEVFFEELRDLPGTTITQLEKEFDPFRLHMEKVIEANGIIT